jgi:hypothetical protein
MTGKWIYRTLVFDWVGSFEPVQKKLDELGARGWEAVGITNTANAVGLTARCVILLKKPDLGEQSDNDAGLRLKQLLKEEKERNQKDSQ